MESVSFGAGTAVDALLEGSLFGGLDGIVVFGSDFSIHAYSAFINVEKVGLSETSGGARSLAMSALRMAYADKFFGVLSPKTADLPQQMLGDSLRRRLRK